jgi:SagB-type dehydrogenase family enzyme
MSQPQHILERVERLYSYHQRSKHLAMGGRLGAPAGDPGYVVSPFRVFHDAPRVALPTTLLDAPVATLTLLAAGQDAVPDSLRAPPQDLKTLASWLYYAAGESRKQQGVAGGRSTAAVFTRSFADAAECPAIELYVAAFAVKGLEPGLYHFGPREFALRRLRDGAAPLMLLKKGRPDLEFLKTLPAAILVSATYCRAVHRHGRRGYRSMLLESGQMVQNLVAAGAGLGAQTVTRLRMNDSTLRELIGCPLDEPLATAESVMAMVAWADRAVAPIALPAAGELTGATPAPAAAGPLPPIARARLSEKVMDDPASVEPMFVHQDCIAPGVAVREIRPPLTELSPLPANFPTANVRPQGEPEGGLPIRHVLLDRRPGVRLARGVPLTRREMLEINRAAFRGGSFFPMFPDGPHVATVRPFWIVQDVTGFDRGIWYYHPPTDQWSLLRGGPNGFRREARYVAGDRDPFGDAAAVCILTANLHALMTQGGPDAYRLAHLEAGIAGQRVYLAATSQKLGTVNSQDFYDDDCRNFLGLGKTGWEVLSVVGVGRHMDPAAALLEERARALGQNNLW